ncbi:hypothetical protein [Rickettsia endosymbiont of Culicoides newsteadi]|uniref:hypothetical protein n=1 Tax=Rickettsia endosymbiont of Culicoides newsteadi TaxID=1961830 RepID=UPI000B9C0987|nr:hypothetical protein [Rickettsia endosymbiont of Culicoides newsteadi]OZG31339.1 hypothetical protein RiCNE_12790 [Rickettsia endosymbiont of Culicoides newsteadi]
MILNTFQLRTARSVLNIGVREIGSIINVNRTTISVWENQRNFVSIKNSQDNNTLIKFFKENGIIFPGEKSIALDINTSNKLNLLSRFQIRVARVAMHLTQQELATLLEIPLLLLNYLEKQHNNVYISSTPKTINEFVLRSFFEKNGICFPKDFCVHLEKDPRELINNY